jgi:hypothetical protein
MDARIINDGKEKYDSYEARIELPFFSNGFGHHYGAELVGYGADEAEAIRSLEVVVEEFKKSFSSKVGQPAA